MDFLSLRKQYHQSPKSPQHRRLRTNPRVMRGTRTRVTHCPYCMKVIDPPPKRSRKCPFCREKLILRRHRLFTVSQGAEFDARLAAERALKETAREAEQARYVCLPEQPASEEQYCQIIRRNAYVWSLARFENGRLRPPDLWDSVVEPSSGFRLRRRSSTRVAAWCRDR